MDDGAGARGPRAAIVVKGYPRLSETFVVQELLALERRGLALEVWSLRRPTDKYVHPMHRQLAAPVTYLPEYLYRAPLRVLRGFVAALRRPGFGRLSRAFLRDLRRDPTPNRIRRFGQAVTLANELDAGVAHLHVHFLHTPGSVARYCALLTGRSFSFSAHARDIWTTPDWELREKIADAAWGVTCTAAGLARLQAVADPADRDCVRLAYHGLDLSRFPGPPQARDGDGAPGRPVTIVTVGRAVEKKGFGDLIEALARLPRGLDWRLIHVGSGPLLGGLKRRAEALGVAPRIEWRGSRPQDAVIEALREADLFALAAKHGADGDRDGLPNVLMEAASQGLPAVATRVGGVAEFVVDGETGTLTDPGDVAALAGALERLVRDPVERGRLGRTAYARLRAYFSFEGGVDLVEAKLRESAERRALAP
jgi:glycosyltransferase involved in cell wall biosynthesis